MRLETAPTPSTPKTATSFNPDDKNNNVPKGDQSKNNDGNFSASLFSESMWNNMGSVARRLYPNRKPAPKGGNRNDDVEGGHEPVGVSVDGHISICSNMLARMTSPPSLALLIHQSASMRAPMSVR